MKRMIAAVLAVSLAGAFAGAGCSSATNARVCQPKQRVKCLCKDGGKGTQLCSEDGSSFASECEQCVKDSSSTEQDLTQNPNIMPTIPDPVKPDAKAEPKGECGNKIAEAGEACDGTPGCNAKCLPETAAFAGCDGAGDVHVWGATPISFSADSVGFSTLSDPDAMGSCLPFVQTYGQGVYTVKIHAAGRLSVKVTPTSEWSPAVSIRGKCRDLASQRACAYTGSTAVADARVESGEVVFVLIDGSPGIEDKYQVEMSIQ